MERFLLTEEALERRTFSLEVLGLEEELGVTRQIQGGDSLGRGSS